MAWRWASASVVGTAHVHNERELQDAFVVTETGNGCILAVVSDGAGTAAYGAWGSRLTCRFLSRKLRKWHKAHTDLPSNDSLAEWIDELRDRISGIATRRSTTARQFAATLAAIIIAPDEVVTLHIGDSAIVGRKGTEWETLCWPENGEYASSTYFVTDMPGPRLNIGRHACEHNAYALFSDGVGDLALSHTDQVAHSRFFDPIFRPVDNASSDGALVALSEKLAAYLASPLVCERTDDDKTIILLSGR